MRVLFVANRLPYAGVAGGYSIIYQRIVGLTHRGHDVGLVAFSRTETPAQVEEMRKQIFEVQLVEAPPNRSFLRRLRDWFFIPVPSRFRSFRSKKMKQCIGNMVEQSRYDVVVTEFARMGQLIYHNPYLPAVRRVMSCHRSLSMFHEEEVAYLGLSPVALYEKFRQKGMKAYEFDLYRSADQVLVLTPQERYWMLSRIQSVHVSVVPGGVDVAYYQKKMDIEQEEAIVFTGSYRDPSNEDAVLWFILNVWPLLLTKNPGLKFYVVGPAPTPAMLQLAEQNTGVHVVGNVDDLRNYLQRAKVFVCPVRLGAGIRTKVLEAMAAGIPIVSTVLGMEGVPALAGENCFMADEPNLMAEYTELLLHDSALSASIAEHACTLVEERFAWEKSIDRLEQTLLRIIHHDPEKRGQ